MRTISVSEGSGDRYFCDITRFMNSWLTGEYNNWLTKKYTKGTYFNDIPSVDNIAILRFPGATRGHVDFNDDGTILEFKIYNNHPDIDCYCDGLEELLNLKYAGALLVFNK